MSNVQFAMFNLQFAICNLNPQSLIPNPMPPPDLASRLETALQAAKRPARSPWSNFRRDDLKVDRKRDDSPVTIADRRAEEHLRTRIAASFPGRRHPGRGNADQPAAAPSAGSSIPLMARSRSSTACRSTRRSSASSRPRAGRRRDSHSGPGRVRLCGRRQGAWYVHGRQPPRRPGL